MDNATIKMLAQKAIEVRKNAYTPYSHFNVGAALLTANGKVYTGVNIESSTFSPTNCAERTAFFKAISEGERDFVAIAVVGAPDGQEISQECPPCGVCRQVMSEFCDYKTFEIILPKSPNEWNAYKLYELLPLQFDLLDNN